MLRADTTACYMAHSPSLYEIFNLLFFIPSKMSPVHVFCFQLNRRSPEHFISSCSLFKFQFEGVQPYIPPRPGRVPSFYIKNKMYFTLSVALHPSARNAQNSRPYRPTVLNFSATDRSLSITLYVGWSGTGRPGCCPVLQLSPLTVIPPPKHCRRPQWATAACTTCTC